MIGALPINLVLSLTFGVGQIVVGGWFAAHSMARGRGWRTGVLVSAGLWFVVSGMIELLVSGMEASERLTGAPTSATFELWRGRGDLTLAVATVALACLALIWSPLARLWARSRRADDLDAEAEAGVEAGRSAR